MSSEAHAADDCPLAAKERGGLPQPGPRIRSRNSLQGLAALCKTQTDYANVLHPAIHVSAVPISCVYPLPRCVPSAVLNPNPSHTERVQVSVIETSSPRIFCSTPKREFSSFATLVQLRSWSQGSPTCPTSARATIVPQSLFLARQTTPQTLTSGPRAV